ncbi:hypothetical protein QJU39_08620, partial [Pasteurella atlantica]|nr:hypothetical protein [Pasteurella atlantica]
SKPMGTGTEPCKTTVNIKHIDTEGNPLPEGIVVVVYDKANNPRAGDIDKFGISTHSDVLCGKIRWRLFEVGAGERAKGYDLENGRMLLKAKNTITGEESKHSDSKNQEINPLKISVAVSRNQIISTYTYNCSCDQPTENYPYSARTFKLIEEMAPIISTYSQIYKVPPIAVAGAIADEYNTSKGLKRFFDWIQDDVLLNYMPNFAIEFDAVINSNSKLFNATKHDLGVGNIKLETAKTIYDNNKNEFGNLNWDYTDVVDYLRTRDGTAHMTAIYIAEANEKLNSYIQDYPDCKKEAVLVTYYKQGPSYLSRFLKAKKLDPNRRILPGEGCRVCLQRDKFLKIFSKRYWDQIGGKYYA